MSALLLARWVHLIAAAVWTGGLITLAVAVLALRRHGADREALRAVARAFAIASWTAMGVAVVTGVAQVQLMGLPWSYGRLHIKLGMVTVAIGIAAVHQLTARSSGPAIRGILELAMLLSGLGIFAAAVAL